MTFAVKVAEYGPIPAFPLGAGVPTDLLGGGVSGFDPKGGDVFVVEVQQSGLVNPINQVRLKLRGAQGDALVPAPLLVPATPTPAVPVAVGTVPGSLLIGWQAFCEAFSIEGVSTAGTTGVTCSVSVYRTYEATRVGEIVVTTSAPPAPGTFVSLLGAPAGGLSALGADIFVIEVTNKGAGQQLDALRLMARGSSTDTLIPFPLANIPVLPVPAVPPQAGGINGTLLVIAQDVHTDFFDVQGSSVAGINPVNPLTTSVGLYKSIYPAAQLGAPA